MVLQCEVAPYIGMHYNYSLVKSYIEIIGVFKMNPLMDSGYYSGQPIKVSGSLLKAAQFFGGEISGHGKKIGDSGGEMIKYSKSSQKTEEESEILED